MPSYLMITGATGGLGSALALEAAKLGFSLFLTDVRPDGGAFAQLLSSEFSIEAEYRVCDLRSAPARADLLNSLTAQDYRFWGLLNVAGLDFEGAFCDRSRDQVLCLLQLNIEATLDMTHGLLKLRDLDRTFRLLNVSSLAAFQPMPYKAMYAASKRFLLDFSRALGEELRGIATVTALCPAGLPTTAESTRRIFAQGILGRMSAMDTETVAKLTLRHLLHGRRIYVPGLLNQVIRHLGSLLPEPLLTRLVGKRWGTAQQNVKGWLALQALAADRKQLTATSAK